MSRMRLQSRGKVTFIVRGDEPVRFFNLCRAANLLLMDVEETGGGYICSMYLTDFRKIRPLRRKAHVQIRICKKEGIPFLLHRVQVRMVFFIGAAVSFLLLFICYQFIWDIRIEGNSYYSDQMLLRALKEQQVYCGRAKKSISPRSVAAGLRSSCERLSWVSVEMEGTVLNVSVKEADYKSTEEKEEARESSLYAEKEGRIVSIVTRKGVPCVQAGDYIYAGDLLVDGEIPILDDAKNIVAYEYCQADADIVIEASYGYYDELNLDYERKLYTGKSLTGIWLHVGESNRILQKKQESGDVELETSFFQWRLGESFILPVSHGLIYEKSYTYEAARYTQEEAEEKLNLKFHEFLEQLDKKVMQITANNVRIKTTENSCIASGSIEVQELTGISLPVIKHENTIERNLTTD